MASQATSGPDVEFDIFLVEQPHLISDAKALSSISAKIRSNSAFPAGQVTVLSEWRQQGERVWSRSFKGAYADNDSIYDLRRQQTTTNDDAAAVDVVALPVPSNKSSPSGRRVIKLAVFDMDSTLIEQEVIDELARVIGKYHEVAEITERAMQGQLDFAGSLRERVALLRGLHDDVWEQVKPRIIFSEGARTLCRELKKQGAQLAVLSGGFAPLAEWVKDELKLDFAHANFLESEGPNRDFDFVHLNGKLVEGKPIVTAERKRELLLQLAKESDIALSDVLCVGDGANDLNMLREVGEGGGIAIALKAKPKVQAAAPNKLNSRSMTDILYLLGYSQSEIEAASAS